MRVFAFAFALALVSGLGACKNDKPMVGSGGVVPVMVDSDGFKPSSVTFPKGGPATLVFTRTTNETCATEVVFPELNVRKLLPKDQPVSIPIPTDKEQTLTFQCGMGMYKSSVVIAAK